MRQLAVISGKGGTGKTTLVGALASLTEKKVLADADVDAANLHLLLKPKIVEEEDFIALPTAVIDSKKCTKCNLCERACRFKAIEEHKIDPLSCEGCGVCELVCPENAVTMRDKVAGKAYTSETRFGPLCHARLKPGEEASGKLVTLVRNNAKKVAEKQNLELIIVDGAPGIGCPVIASIGGVDLALIVSEPTMSGIHDLKRILGVCSHFKVEPIVCVNKYDINEEKTDEIEAYCRDNNIVFAGKIPYNEEVIRAMVEGKTIMECCKKETKENVEKIWSNVEYSI